MPGLDREALSLAGLAVLVLLCLAAGAWFLYHPASPEPPETSTVDTAVPPEPPVPREISYPGRDGATVLELLKERHTVRLDSELMLFGAIVLDIDSLRARSDEFWIFYKDSVRGDRPPDECTTRTGEWIHWVLLQRR